KIIHHTQIRGSQEKGDRIMSIPPLHQCILHAGIYIVTFPETHRQLNGIYNMQDRDSYKSCYIKPDGHIHMPFPTSQDSTKHIDSENHPNQGNSHIDWPFHLSIFVRRGIT